MGFGDTLSFVFALTEIRNIMAREKMKICADHVDVLEETRVHTDKRWRSDCFEYRVDVIDPGKRVHSWLADNGNAIVLDM